MTGRGAGIGFFSSSSLFPAAGSAPKRRARPVENAALGMKQERKLSREVGGDSPVEETLSARGEEEVREGRDVGSERGKGVGFFFFF